MKIVIVGLGGIGSNLLDPIVRIVYTTKLTDNTSENSPAPHIVLVDGDIYELKNLKRQQAWTDAVGVNKAKLHADRLLKNKVYVSYLDEYITPKNIENVISDGDIVLGCVDQHASRKLISDYCAGLQDSLFISGGNDIDTGDVLVQLKIAGELLSNKIDSYHPEIKFPKDKRPDELGCEQQIAQGNTQLISTNFMVAAWMVSVFHTLYVPYMDNEVDQLDKISFDEILFSLKSSKSGKIKRGMFVKSSPKSPTRAVPELDF